MNIVGYASSKYFYSHVNYSVTKIEYLLLIDLFFFYSHVNYSVTKMNIVGYASSKYFYSHVNYSVTKMSVEMDSLIKAFTVT